MLSLTASFVGALLFGLADFLGGLSSRRLDASRVVVTSQLLGLLVLVPMLVLLPSTLDTGSIGWGAAAGVANAVGLVLFYRALAAGAMTVVAPLAALCSALVPLIAGLLFGERLAPSAVVGAICALVAIVLVSSQGGRGPSLRDVLASRSTLIAMAAGATFGVFFLLISRATPESGLYPLAAARVVSILLILLAYPAARAVCLPRASVPTLAGAGVAGNLGNALFVLGVHTGLLSISGLVSSLYPAATVLLAIVVLRERIARVQALGFLLTAAALTLIAIR